MDLSAAEKWTTLAIAIMMSVASVAHAQTTKPRPNGSPPDFKVQVWGDIVTRFDTRLRAYAELRGELEKGLPPLRITDDPSEIRRAERALAKRIRRAREGAKPGDIFSPDITDEFRKALHRVMNAHTWAVIMDDNPGAFPVRVNGAYPRLQPLSAVPSNILTALPRLPNDVEYRFVGRHLILLDIRARVILDRIPYAIQSPQGDTPGQR
jgi:hypothetical protein